MNSREKTPKPFSVEFRIWHLHDVRIQSNKHQKKSRGYPEMSQKTRHIHRKY